MEEKNVVAEADGCDCDVPSVVIQSSTPVQDRCDICLGSLEGENANFRCECGNISHESCAKQLGLCSACGEVHTERDFLKNRRFAALMQSGRKAYDSNCYDEALHRYDEALKLRRKSTPAWNYKGTILARQGRFDMALECYNNALEIEKCSTTCYNKAVVLLKMDMPEETLECITDAIELKPEDGWSWYLKGCTLLKMNRSIEAVKCFDRALALIPENHLTWLGKGSALMNLKMLDEALRCCEQALALEPGDTEVLLATGRILLAENRMDEAVSVFDEILGMNPHHEGARRFRQRALAQNDK